MPSVFWRAGVFGLMIAKSWAFRTWGRPSLCMCGGGGRLPRLPFPQEVKSWRFVAPTRLPSVPPSNIWRIHIKIHTYAYSSEHHKVKPRIKKYNRRKIFTVWAPPFLTIRPLIQVQLSRLVDGREIPRYPWWDIWESTQMQTKLQHRPIGKCMERD